MAATGGPGIQAKARKGPGHKARGGVGTKAGLWLIASRGLQPRGHIILLEDRLQARRRGAQGPLLGSLRPCSRLDPLAGGDG